VRVLVSNIVAEDRVRVTQQRGLLDEVRQSIFVALGADLQACFVGRSGWVRSGLFFPVGLGVFSVLEAALRMKRMRTPERPSLNPQYF
jgi:hypothetical protein